MTLGAFFTSLIPIASVSSLITEVLATIGLFIDGIIYQLLSYAFKLFYLMCQLNFDSLYSIVSPLIDRLQALIMVFIVFKLGVELINYLLNPDSAQKESPKLIKNIFITAALLISYTFIFGVLNEFSMLLIGVPDHYEFKRLNELADVTNDGDQGLINRFIFGNAKVETEIGDFIAFKTLSIFINDNGNTNGDIALKEVIADGDQYNFKNIKKLSSLVDKTVIYHGLISTLVGIYLIVCIVKSAIEVGIRMFKLLLLQIMAPIAIVSIIKDGTKGKTFSNYCKVYLDTFIQVFIRIASMLIITVFISQFFINIGNFFGDNIESASGLITKGLLMALICVAGFKFASDAPKFIDQILGTKLAEDKSGGFGSFLTGAIGLGVGAAAGGITALSSGAGFLGGIANIASGAVTGAQAGAKGNTVSEKIKNLSGAAKKDRERAVGWGNRGGFNQVALGAIQTPLKGSQDKRISRLDRQAAALDAYAAAQNNAIKETKMSDSDMLRVGTDADGSAIMQSVSDFYSDGIYDVKLGEDKGAYAAEAIKYDKSVMKAQAELDVATDSGDATKIAEARENLQNKVHFATERLESYYDERKNNIENDTSIHEVLRADVAAKREAYVNTGGTMNKVGSSSNNVKTEKQRIYREKSVIQNKSSYSRTHGQNPK